MSENRGKTVKQMFAEVPATYERANHLLTLGLDIAWRRRMVRQAARGGGGVWVDMCTGTGETAAYLARLAGAETRVHAVDFSGPMLAEARQKPEAARIVFHECDIQHLPFEEKTVDLVTMSFATRNINLSRDALVRSFAEYRRVLKPGGHFVNLETSRPPVGVIKWFFDSYVQLVVARVGSRISGTRTPYAYLAGTMQRFHGAEELAEIMREAGFAQVSFKRLMFGVAAIHEAVKK